MKFRLCSTNGTKSEVMVLAYTTRCHQGRQLVLERPWLPPSLPWFSRGYEQRISKAP